MTVPTAVPYLYQTGGGEELILRFGEIYTCQVVLIEALFEERNFLRRIAMQVGRALQSYDIGCSIPDMPGTGESLIDVADVTLPGWQSAVADAARFVEQKSGTLPFMAALRGGALIDHTASAKAWWRFAPASGAELLRPMRQARRICGAADQQDHAGYRLNEAMVAALDAAMPQSPTGPLRQTPVRPDGIAPWRLAEPGDDQALANALADDLAQWIATCAAS